MSKNISEMASETSHKRKSKVSSLKGTKTLMDMSELARVTVQSTSPTNKKARASILR